MYYATTVVLVTKEMDKEKNQSVAWDPILCLENLGLADNVAATLKGWYLNEDVKLKYNGEKCWPKNLS